jgi:ABC-type glutathione transport system ATPase component
MRDTPATPARDPLLLADDVHVELGGRPVLRGVTAHVGAGEIVGLIGETGSGKTTFARAALGLLRPARGTVTVDGVDVAGLRRRAQRDFRRAGHVQYVFQDPLRSLDPDATVGRSVGEGLRAQGDLTAAEIRERVATTLAEVGLDESLAGRTPGRLSGGQRQRVAIARAVAVRPRLLLCDEPVSALDAVHRNHVLRLLAELRTARGLGLLLISHDLGSVATVSDRVLVLHHGRVVEQGTTAQVLGAPEHPYTRLLVASSASVRRPPASRQARDELRQALLASA